MNTQGGSRVTLVHVLFSAQQPRLTPGKERRSNHGRLTCGINYRRKIEEGSLSFPSFPNKQAVPLRLFVTVVRDSNQEAASVSSSFQQNAEPARGRDGCAHNGFLQLLWKRRRQAEAQQGRVKGAAQQRAHRLPHVSEGSDAGGEDHERPGLEQRQRGGLQRVCCVGGRSDCRLQRLLPRAEEENQVDVRS